MTHPISRRSLAKGAAWAAPAVIATTAIPAYAASSTSCSTTAIAAIDAAFKEMETSTFTAYWTEPSVGLADGFSKVPSFNIINNSSYDVELSGSQGLVVEFAAVRANGDTRLPNGPLTAATSWGKTSRVTEAVVDGQAARTWTWTATGENLVGNARGNDNVSDTNFSTGTNIDGIKVRATLIQAPVIYSTLSSIATKSGLDLAACEAYYQSKLSTVVPVTISFAGPLFTEGTAIWGNGGTTRTLFGGATAWSVGSSVWSNVSGNYRSDTYPPGVINNATGISNNGIF